MLLFLKNIGDRPAKNRKSVKNGCSSIHLGLSKEWLRGQLIARDIVAIKKNRGDRSAKNRKSVKNGCGSIHLGLSKERLRGQLIARENNVQRQWGQTPFEKGRGRDSGDRPAKNRKSVKNGCSSIHLGLSKERLRGQLIARDIVAIKKKQRGQTPFEKEDA